MKEQPAFRKLAGYFADRLCDVSRDACVCNTNGATHRDLRFADDDDDLATAVGFHPSIECTSDGVAEPGLKQVGFHLSIECASDDTHGIVEPGRASKLMPGITVSRGGDEPRKLRESILGPGCP